MPMELLEEIKNLTETNNNKDAIFGLNDIRTSLRSRIKIYKKMAEKVESYLLQHPDEWGRFQSEFNTEVNAIFREIMNFERLTIANGSRHKIDKLKSIFIDKIRELFLKSKYFEWSLHKPYGYTGDFKIIDDMYQNNPTSTGFKRLFDNYFQMAAICVAVRDRKEDFKRIITKFINERQNQSLRIMSLGCGPCRELKEMLDTNLLLNKDVIFDCYDHDENALQYARSLLTGHKNINFIKENALKLAASKTVTSRITKKYDFIYVLGVVDYFNHKVSVRLISNLKKLLKIKGMMIISNVRDRYSNPSVHCMEWVGDWILIYRNEEEFKKIFLEAGFDKSELRIQYEQQGIMQYGIASLDK